MGLRSKSIKDWTNDEIAQVKVAYQDCFDDFQETLTRASENKQSIYIKEHVHFLIDPTTLSDYVFGPASPLSEADSTRNASGWTLEHLQADSWSSDDESSCPSRGANNITLLPDEFLQTWKPTFLIRHPALAFPSLYRALLTLEGTRDESEDEVLGEHCMTLPWTRYLYDWYREHYNREGWSRSSNGRPGAVEWPMVLDADDIIANPQRVARYCALLHMDPSKLSFSWDTATGDEMSRLNLATQRYLDTLLASGGVLKDKMSGDVNLDELAYKWQREFGPRVGQRIARLVKEAMPHYECLKARRLLA